MSADAASDFCAAQPGDGDPGRRWPLVRKVLVRLTDEEAFLLAGGLCDPVSYPYLSSLDDEEQQRAQMAAERSLRARGILHIVDADTPESLGLDRDPFPWDLELSVGTTRVDPSLSAAMAVRGGSVVIYVVHRQVCSAPSTWVANRELTRYLFVVGEVIVVEDVTAEGMHVLSSASLASLEGLLAEFVLPPGAGAAPESSPVLLGVQLTPTEVAAKLHDPLVLAEGCLLSPWDSTTSTLFAAGEGGCYQGDLGQAPNVQLEPLTAASGIVTEAASKIRCANRRQVAEISRLPGDQGTMTG